MRAMPHLAFVMSRHQNLFFRELVEAIQEELSGLGVPHSVHTDGFPEARPDLVYVLVPPHEYFVLEDERPQDVAGLLARSVFVCAEQPGTTHFDDNVKLAPYAAAVFDINPWAVREFHRRGVPLRHFQV